MSEEGFSKVSLRDICLTQLRIGATGFGGPLATIAMMRLEWVERKSVLSSHDFLSGLSLMKLLPGPVSSLMAIWLGHRLRGFWGGLLSGICFILPCFLMILVFAAFVSFEVLSKNPAVRSALEGMQVAVLALVFFSAWSLLKDSFHENIPETSDKGRFEKVLIGVVAGVGVFYKVHEIAVLLFSIFLGFILIEFKSRLRSRKTREVGTLLIFSTFFFSSLTVFGTGYMLLPVLERKLVLELGLLSQDQFLQSILLGNLTPGPIVIAGTHMGFQIQGWEGALWATLGVFLPSFFIVLFLVPIFLALFGDRFSFLKSKLRFGLIPAVGVSIFLSSFSLLGNVSWNLGAALILLFAFFAQYKKWPAWLILIISGTAATIF